MDRIATALVELGYRHPQARQDLGRLIEAYESSKQKEMAKLDKAVSYIGIEKAFLELLIWMPHREMIRVVQTMASSENWQVSVRDLYTADDVLWSLEQENALDKKHMDMFVQAMSAEDLYEFLETISSVWSLKLASPPSKKIRQIQPSQIARDLGITQERAAELLDLLAANENATGRRASDVLDQANDLIEGFGVEPIRDADTWDRYWGDTVALYVNTGDSYNLTVLYDVENEQFHITTYGDFVE